MQVNVTISDYDLMLVEERSLHVGAITITAESREAAERFAACANAWAKQGRLTIAQDLAESRIENYAAELLLALEAYGPVDAAIHTPDSGLGLSREQHRIRHAIAGVKDALGLGEAQR